MLLTRPLQAFGAIFRHKPSTNRAIEQKSSKNYLGGNIAPAPNQQIDWFIEVEMLMNNVKSSCTNEEITAWLRGLLTIAWSDGKFDENEQQLIVALSQDELDPLSADVNFEAITPLELAAVLGKGTAIGENFLRTAVMVALADGTYSICEDELLHKFCTALGQNVEVIEALRHTIEGTQYPPQQPTSSAATEWNVATPLSAKPLQPPHQNVLKPVKDWLDAWEVHDPKVAHFVCKMIPSQCPFERDVVLFGRKIVHIPAMCQINPLYEQLVGMRFRALCYLADDCKEDISSYC